MIDPCMAFTFLFPLGCSVAHMLHTRARFARDAPALPEPGLSLEMMEDLAKAGEEVREAEEGRRAAEAAIVELEFNHTGKMLEVGKELERVKARKRESKLHWMNSVFELRQEIKEYQKRLEVCTAPVDDSACDSMVDHSTAEKEAILAGRRYVVHSIDGCNWVFREVHGGKLAWAEETEGTYGSQWDVQREGGEIRRYSGPTLHELPKDFRVAIEAYRARERAYKHEAEMRYHLAMMSSRYLRGGTKKRKAPESEPPVVEELREAVQETYFPEGKR